MENKIFCSFKSSCLLIVLKKKNWINWYRNLAVQSRTIRPFSKLGMSGFFIVNAAGYNAKMILTQANNITTNYVLIHEDFRKFQVMIFQKRQKSFKDMSIINSLI